MKYLKQSSLVNRSIIGKKSYVSISCSHTETSYKIYSIFDNMSGWFLFDVGKKKRKICNYKRKKKINTIYMILKKRYLKIYDLFRVPLDKYFTKIDWLIDYIVFYAVSTIFRPYTAKRCLRMRIDIHVYSRNQYPLLKDNVKIIQ